MLGEPAIGCKVAQVYPSDSGNSYIKTGLSQDLTKNFKIGAHFDDCVHSQMVACNPMMDDE